MSTRTWKFDRRNLDTSVSPQDDFFHFANGGWVKRHTIPKTESHWGTFMILRYEIEKKLEKIIKELSLRKRVKHGSPEQMLRDFYRSGMDKKRRDSLGLSPLQPWLHKINCIQNNLDFQDVLAEFHRMGIGALFNVGIDQDAKNTKQYRLHFFQDGLGMPDRDYYLKNDPESRRVRHAYEQHLVAIFKLTGRNSKEAEAQKEKIMHIEKCLAKISMNKVDRREIDKTYHKLNITQVQKICPAINWKRYCVEMYASHTRECIVMQLAFFKGITPLITSVSLSDWKIYLEWNLVNDFAMHLSSRIARQNFLFYGKTLYGIPSMKPLWRQVLGTVNGALGELLGQVFVKKYFPPAAKREMNCLVDDLFETYRERITKLDWMGEQTKKKALQKLANMNRKIGYPDKWKSFKGLVIRPDDYVGNLARTMEYVHRREMKKLRKPIDRTEWFMYPQTVNAYNAPNMNEIVFPAAILQPPFFTLGGDPAQNYGSIGSVIAHEISHGFDDEGSKFDHDGNFKSWWAAADKKRFVKKSKVLEKQFNAYALHGVRVNGKLTLGENIADLGGASIAYDAYKRACERKPSTVLNGFTPEQRFFLGFALFERERSRPEFLKTQMLTNPHSPHIFRINGPLSNLPEFYEAWGVKRGDKLYREPRARARIW